MYFLDTNVVVYCFDPGAPAKQQRALGVVQHALDTGEGVISFQVIQEFLDVALRKFAVPLSPEDCRSYLQAVLSPLCGVFPRLDLYRLAIELKAETSYSFSDSLIVAAALEAGCDELYTEDMRAGQRIRGLLIVDPF